MGGGELRHKLQDSYLEGRGSVEFGCINGVRRHVGYVGDELF